MGTYGVSFRGWAAFTAVLVIGLFVWDCRQTPPRGSLVPFYGKLLTEGDRELTVKALFVTPGLVLIPGAVAWVVLVMATQLARWLNPPPASVQDADYDDAG